MGIRKNSGLRFDRACLHVLALQQPQIIAHLKNEGSEMTHSLHRIQKTPQRLSYGMTAEERQALAFHMRHSVNTSYKYVRDLTKDSTIDVQRLRHEVQPTS